MKEFLSNSWVVSIISGIIVFVLTNIFIDIKNRSKYKKQIYDANIMILNHLRGYVVDNGLPKVEIIEAVKSSIAREYIVKSDDLLCVKSICEELVKDIIGNTYISNDNKKKYIEMLQNYLTTNIDIKSNDDKKNYKNTITTKIDFSTSILAATITAIATICSAGIATENINADKFRTIVYVLGVFGFIVFFIIWYIKFKLKR